MTQMADQIYIAHICFIQKWYLKTEISIFHATILFPNLYCTIHLQPQVTVPPTLTGLLVTPQQFWYKVAAKGKIKTILIIPWCANYVYENMQTPCKRTWEEMQRCYKAVTQITIEKTHCAKYGGYWLYCTAPNLLQILAWNRPKLLTIW